MPKYFFTLTKLQLNKSYDDFYLLNEHFTSFLPVEIPLPALDVSSIDTISKYINDIIIYCDFKIWEYPILLRFLDDMYGKSFIGKIQVDNMFKKVFTSVSVRITFLSNCILCIH